MELLLLKVWDDWALLLSLVLVVCLPQMCQACLWRHPENG